MQSLRLLGRRRFLPLFATQFLNAFNDNLFKTAMVMLVIYRIYQDPAREVQFSALAGALFILPFFLFSAHGGQLADTRDKAGIVRIIKSAEIGIMVVGAAGLLLPSIPLMLTALFAMGVHSAFFGPIKYAILPQHLRDDEVLAGTGLVEAGTYGAILLGTIAGGLLGVGSPGLAAVAVLGFALVGRVTATFVPAAPPERECDGLAVDWNPLRASVSLVRRTMHVPRLFRAIVAISFFWSIGAVLAAQFPPLVKNVLGSDQQVATLFLAIFSVGVALGSVVINRLLKGEVSARWSPVSALVMGAFLVDLFFTTSSWEASGAALLNLRDFLAQPLAGRVLLDLFGVAVAGGMFVVPLYAFLTTTVPKAETARTVAANNIVNAGAMVASTLLLAGLTALGVGVAQSLLMVAAGCAVAAWIAWRLHQACRAVPRTA